ncbi:hypothetical protein N9V96_03855 [Polaribacter sp.]|nr:hypothetical protein [Polaribacter sp.]
MKKCIIILILVLGICSCESDANSSVSSDASGDGQGGSLATFALKNDYLYAVDTEGLSVFNIQDKTNPVKVNSVFVGFAIETLFPFDNYLFIGSQDAMFIYDISNPEFPKELSRSGHFRSCDPVVANEKYAYVTLHSNSRCFGELNELHTYNVEDVENPILLNVRQLTEPKGLASYNTDYLIVCDDSVKIFDVSNPEESKYIKQIDTNDAIDIIIRENRAFVITANSIEQYDLNPNDIEQITTVSTFTF